MSYHVYENWQATNKAVIHYSDCAWCKHGKGLDPHSSEKHGKWSFSLPTFDSAKNYARATGRPVKLCGHCKPK